MKKKVNISYIYFILPIIFFLFIAYAKDVDDFWFLIAHGRYVLNHGFPTTDFLTIHKGLHFVMQQWGFSTILYFMYHNFSSIGVFFFVGIVNLGILYFIYRLCMTISSNNIYASCLVSSIIDILLELNFILPRPQIISILLFVILLYILERYTKNKNDKSIFFLPLLSIILVNTHASMWLMIFILSMPFFVEYLYFYFKEKDNKWIRFSWIMILSFCVGILNPYKTEAMFYSLSSYGIKLINLLIREMHSFSLTGDSYLVCNSSLILAIIILELIIYFRNRKKYSLHTYFLFLGLSFMAILNLRNISVLLIGTLPYIVNGISIQSKSKISICIFLPITIISLLIFNYNYQHGFYQIEDTTRYGVVQYLKKNTNKQIKVFTYFNDGPYLEYNGYKVYMDTRAEIFLKKNNHKEDIFEEYYNVLTGNINFSKFIEKYKFTHFVTHKKTPIYNYLKKNSKYKIVYKDKEITLFAKISI